MRAFAWLLLSALCAVGQTLVVEGTVSQALTHQPLPGVNVRLVLLHGSNLSTAEPFGGVTDRAGRFRIGDIRPGRYLVAPELRGFMYAPSSNVIPIRDGVNQDLAIELVPQAVVTGRVVDSDGEPLQHVMIDAQRASGPAASNAFRTGSVPQTDDRGVYSLVLAPGLYYIEARPAVQTRWEIRTDGATPFKPGITYYPAAMAKDGASIVEARAGEETAGIDIQLGAPADAGRRFAISGVVTGLPPGSLAVLTIREKKFSRGLVTDEQGRFAANALPVGEYELLAVAGDLISSPVAVSLNTGDVSKVELRLQPPVDVVGRLHVEGLHERWVLTLEPAEPALSFQPGTRTGEVAADGAFRIAGVPPARMRLRLSAAPKGACITGVEIDGVRLRPADLIPIPARSPVLTVRASRDCGAALRAARLGLLLSLQPAVYERASFSGTVTNSVTGAPVPRAHVTLTPIGAAPDQPDYGVLSDAEGKFTIGPIPAGRYLAGAAKTGFTRVLGASTSAVILEEGEKRAGYKVLLIPGGVITGRVLDANGDPMAGVEVTAPPGMNGGTSEVDGHYRIGGLPPGRYRIVAQRHQLPIPAEHRTDGTKELNYATTTYPSLVTVRAGAETGGIDVQMELLPVLKITGRVLGAPAGKMTSVVLWPRVAAGLERGSFGQVLDDGTFAIWRASPGKYWLHAITPSGGEPLQSAPVAVDVVAADIENLELRMVAAGTVQGSIRWEGDAPAVAPGDVTLKPVIASVREMSAKVGDDGTFTIRRVPVGLYRVRYPGQPAFVKSVSVGSSVSDGNLLDLGGGAGAGPVSVLLDTAVASLSGVVRNGDDPAPGISVVLYDESNAIFPPLSSVSGPDGRYRIGNVAPGTYKLLVLGALEARNGNAGFAILDGEWIPLARGENAVRDLRYEAPDYLH